MPSNIVGQTINFTVTPLTDALCDSLREAFAKEQSRAFTTITFVCKSIGLHFDKMSAMKINVPHRFARIAAEQLHGDQLFCYSNNAQFTYQGTKYYGIMSLNLNSGFGVIENCAVYTSQVQSRFRKIPKLCP